MTNSASAERAVSNARSMAPGSSGLGKATVGKRPSGWICASTTVGAGYPAAASTRDTVSHPTPCIAV